MEYSQPYPSSVPHIILVPRTFNLDKIFYGCSMITEIFFLAFAVICFAFSLYFRIGNHKLLIDHSNKVQYQKDKENIICQVVAKTNFLDKNQDDEESGSLSEKEIEESCNQKKNKNSLQSELLAGQFRIYQRRMIHTITFTISWLFPILFFDANILLIICSSIFLGAIIIFNMKRMLPDWKISILVYFFPSLVATFAYVSGTHQLYSWDQVQDPLKVEI